MILLKAVAALRLLRQSSALRFRCKSPDASLALLILCALPYFFAHAQEAPSRRLVADASAPFSQSQVADYAGGTNRTPDGDTIGVTQRYLTRNGRPWIPVIGELHYSRMPEEQWDDEILKMKASGVTVISTYVFWIHHEEIEGQWDWQGRRNLRRFVQLCERNGMLLWVRVGPWDHGETRNGGLPDWVVKKSPTRQLDPIFMAETKALYDRIGDQLKGLMWKDGGPVIGIQIENEYAQRGPGKGAEYILALKKLALQSGLDVPLYSVTGWDNAVVPPRQVLPVYGGYPDAPWGDSKTELPPQEVYAFRFDSRVTGNMGMIGGNSGVTRDDRSEPSLSELPFLTAEMGGGTQGTYHRRPVVSPEDIAAMMPTMLGSGVNGYGTYMFHGGINPTGKLTTLQESQATGYPTDVPEKDYDFQAPIGAFGLERQSLRLEKEWNYLLDDFGETLAPMPAFAPQVVPKSPSDQTVLRWSVRSNGQGGFVFVNNYVREHPMPPFSHVQFEVKLPGQRRILLPDEPIDIPSDSFFAWPFGLSMDGITLRYGTAQLMAKLSANHREPDTYTFFCVQGVRCELAFAEDTEVKAPSGFNVRKIDGTVLVTDALSSVDPFPQFIVRSRSTGKSVRVIVLSSQQAVSTWELTQAHRKQLLQTQSDVFADDKTVSLQQLSDTVFRFSLYPDNRVPASTEAPVTRGNEKAFTAHLKSANVQVTLDRQRAPGEVPPTKLGPPLSWRKLGVAEAPGDAVWEAASARWSLHLTPQQIPPGVSNIFLQIRFAGDEARLKSGSQLLDDDFFDGRPWTVGLDRFSTHGTVPPLELEILPLRADAPIYLPKTARAEIDTTGQTVKLEGVQALPLYRLSFTDAENSR